MKKEFQQFKHPYPIQEEYSKRAAYFCMEYAVDQSLKIFSGGLGYLAGSHMRSAYELGQNMIGIGILWKYGYYDQIRSTDQSMNVLFLERMYNFLEDPGITFELEVNMHPVLVKAYYLRPGIFGTAPLFFLSTDLPENDYLARTICHRLYDSNVSTKIAQYILLGIGGVKLLEKIGWQPEVYHFNEAHALPAAYYLFEKFGTMEEVRKRIVFTTHTPVPAGNEIHNVDLLRSMSFFSDLSNETVHSISEIDDNQLNLTLNTLRFARLANGVSKLHGEVARKMWGEYDDICQITHVTNAQNAKYWKDGELADALDHDDNNRFVQRKRHLKAKLFEIVADQTGKRFDPDVLTIVWARRYAPYKRADMLTKDIVRFRSLVNNAKYPVQIIWAGKPYPSDYMAIDVFNNLVKMSNSYSNIAVLVGYELHLSKALKQGSDIWLNTPRVTREASGTSGMTAAMNGSINCSTQDGWIPEFGEHGKNSFLISVADLSQAVHDQDWRDIQSLYRLLEDEIIPIYYKQPDRWLEIVKQSMRDVTPFFGSDRMADQYYKTMYSGQEYEREAASSYFENSNGQ